MGVSSSLTALHDTVRALASKTSGSIPSCLPPAVGSDGLGQGGEFMKISILLRIERKRWAIFLWRNIWKSVVHFGEQVRFSVILRLSTNTVNSGRAPFLTHEHDEIGKGPELRSSFPLLIPLTWEEIPGSPPLHDCNTYIPEWEGGLGMGLASGYSFMRLP